MAVAWLERFSVYCEDIIERAPVAGCSGSGDVETYLDWLFQAWGTTALVALLSLAVALVVGAFVGTLRTLPQDKKSNVWLKRLANAWVELFRNIPLLVQILLWYHVVPVLFPVFADFPKLALVVFGLGFFTSARIAEQVRAGIESLPRGQRMASLAMGLTTFQSYRYVILPMAFRIILPPLTSETMNIFKNSSVAYAVSVTELTFFAQQAGEETSSGVQIYLGVTLLYIISAFAINRLMTWIEKRVRIPGMVAPAGGGH